MKKLGIKASPLKKYKKIEELTQGIFKEIFG